MKKSKKLLMEMSGVALPVVRKTLVPEGSGVKFDDIQPGDVVRLPKYKGKEFIVTSISTFGGYIHMVPFKQLEMAKKSELQGATVAHQGLGNHRPIEV